MQIETAIREWKRILGDEHIVVDQAELSRSDEATFATDAHVQAVLLPASSVEIQQLLRVAKKHAIHVHVVSRGRNCGYGSRASYRDSVLIDLRRMNRILAYDEDLACVRLEPGVTQAQLAEFLQQQGGALAMDPIASFPDCSVVGNILERGHGLSADADRIASATDYEIVLPSGELIHTGYSAIEGARAAGLDRWPAGPSLEGLFSQSNFGIVTAMTVWLRPKPERARLVTFALESHAAMSECVNRLRSAKLSGALPFGPRFFNELRLLQTFSRYPWERMQGRTPLGAEPLRELQREMQIPLWTGSVGFCGTEKQIEAGHEIFEHALKHLELETWIVETGSAPPVQGAPLISRFAASLYAGMTGNVQAGTERPRWRRRTPDADVDWSRDRCGLIWFPVTVPFRGEDAVVAVNLVRESVFAHGFEPDMSVSAIRTRTLELNCSIVFDRDDEIQERSAGPCARATLAQLARHGFHSHRLGLPTMGAYAHVQDSNRRLLAGIKSLVDPDGILIAGRY